MRHRSGAATLWVLVVLGVVLAVLLMACDVGLIWNAQAELRAVADAAALAAGHHWAAHLTPEAPVGLPPSLRDTIARGAASYVAKHSPSTSLCLLPNPDNQADGDIVFGFYDALHGFVPARPEDLSSPWLNAVQITIRRDQQHGNIPGLLFGPLFGWSFARVQARAVVLLERRIVGFQCTDGLAIPMVPIAILSDPTGQTPDCWEVQCSMGKKTGNAGANAESAPPQVRVWLPIASDSSGELPASDRVAIHFPAGGNACVLRIGTTDWTQLVRQLATGILPGDLQDETLGGQFALDTETGIRPTAAWPHAAGLNQRELANLITTLAGCKDRQEIRIWPLYAGFLPDANVGVAEDDTVVPAAVNGFVAARILHVELKSVSNAAHPGTYLEILLEPQVLITRTAIPAPRHSWRKSHEDQRVNPYWDQPNPYVVRIQLAE